MKELRGRDNYINNNSKCVLSTYYMPCCGFSAHHFTRCSQRPSEVGSIISPILQRRWLAPRCIALCLWSVRTHRKSADVAPAPNDGAHSPVETLTPGTTQLVFTDGHRGGLRRRLVLIKCFTLGGKWERMGRNLWRLLVKCLILIVLEG